MGVRRCQKRCAVLAVAAGLALAGCRNDLDRDPKVGGSAGDGARLLLTDPQETKPVDPSSPGLEPPLTGMGAAGAAAGPMMNPGPGATGGSNAPVMPPPTGGFAGAGGGAGGANAAGSGAAAGGTGAPMTDPGDAGAGDAGDPDPCATEPECGLLAPCADSLHCISLDGCDHAICITVEAACQAECDSTECAVLESYPEQIACN